MVAPLIVAQVEFLIVMARALWRWFRVSLFSQMLWTILIPFFT